MQQVKNISNISSIGIKADLQTCLFRATSMNSISAFEHFKWN